MKRGEGEVVFLLVLEAWLDQKIVKLRFEGVGLLQRFGAIIGVVRQTPDEVGGAARPTERVLEHL